MMNNKLIQQTKRFIYLNICVACLALSGCQSTAQEETLSAAVIINSNAKTTQELTQIISQTLGAEVIIADDALTQNHWLIVERKQHRNIEHGVLDGRSDETPENFKLVMKKDKCVLTYPKKQREWVLKNVRCRLLAK